MQDFFNSITQLLKIDNSTAENATAQVMGFVKGQVKPELFDEILKKVPALKNIMQIFNQSSGEAGNKDGKVDRGGLFGSLTSIAGAFFGKNAAKGVELVNGLKKLGLGMDDIIKFVTSLFDYLKKNASPETVQKVIEQIPAITKFIK